MHNLLLSVTLVQQTDEVPSFANMFSVALTPFLGQMSQLHENVRLLLSGCEEELEEDGETAYVEDSGRVDIEVALAAILDKTMADKVEPRTGDALLQELAQDSVKEKTSSPIHEGLAGIFNNLFLQN